MPDFEEYDSHQRSYVRVTVEGKAEPLGDGHDADGTASLRAHRRSGRIEYYPRRRTNSEASRPIDHRRRRRSARLDDYDIKLPPLPRYRTPIRELLPLDLFKKGNRIRWTNRLKGLVAAIASLFTRKGSEKKAERLSDTRRRPRRRGSRRGRQSAHGEKPLGAAPNRRGGQRKSSRPQARNRRRSPEPDGSDSQSNAPLGSSQPRPQRRRRNRRNPRNPRAQQERPGPRSSPRDGGRSTGQKRERKNDDSSNR